MYHSEIHVTLRKSILDPQGKAAQHALQNLGLTDIQSVRIGKYIELTLNAASAEEAEQLARKACEKLLANEVMEDFTIKISA